MRSMSDVRRCKWPIRAPGSIGRGAFAAGVTGPCEDSCIRNHLLHCRDMRLTGLHHITMLTGDAQRNVAFYADLLGLRFVKKTVNFDAPEAYHLYFGDERGTPGSILTWFEFPGAARGRAGIGQIHTLQLAVASEAALDFLAARLGTEREGDRIRSQDPDGRQLELFGERLGNPPRPATHPETPTEHAIVGLEG